MVYKILKTSKTNFKASKPIAAAVLIIQYKLVLNKTLMNSGLLERFNW